VPVSRVNVVVSGPLFDGTAEHAVHEFLDRVKADLAQEGQRRIRARAGTMDRSGRGGTGRAAEGVKIRGAGRGDQVISGGIRQGEYAWPWLEGTSRRNTTTRFRGYHAFRKTRLELRKGADEVLQRNLAELVAEMGGDG
jgi:hypothetical protein